MIGGQEQGEAPTQAPEQRARWTLLGWLSALAAIGVVASATLPLDALLRDLSCDDSFYYGRIARELATSGRSSFDGVHETNGYHPLWCWLEVPVHWLFHDPTTALRVTRGLEVLLVLAAAAAWLATCWRCGMAVAASAFVTIYFVRARELVLGMDAGLSVLLLGASSLAAVRYLQRDGDRRMAALLCGVALACVPLARLDQLAFSAFVTAWLLWSWRRRANARAQHDRAELLLLLLPQVVVLGAYFAGNWWCFDSALPVSGLSKQLWSSHTPDEGLARCWRRLAGLLASRAVLDGIVFGALAVAVVAARARRDARWRAGLPIVSGLFASSLARTAYYACTVEPELANYPWYFTSGTLTRYLALALLLDAALRWRGLRRRWRAVAAAAVVVFAVGQHVRQLWRDRALVTRGAPDWEMLSYDGGEWLREHAPPDARVGSFDAGVLGYFAAQRVTNLDGLVQSRAFLEARRRGEPLAEFLDEQRIDWIVNVAGALDELRRKGIDERFEPVHVGEHQRCIDGVERALFVLRRR